MVPAQMGFLERLNRRIFRGNSAALTIALVGFYNVENAGDERLKLAWQRILDRHLSAVFNINAATPDVLRHFDWVLIGGGSILHRHAPIFQTDPNKFLSRKQKVGVAGISASGQFDLDQLPIVRSLARRAEFFIVRDRSTLEVLDCEAVSLGPDISWCVPFEHYDLTAEYDLALSLAPCPWNAAFKIDDWIATLEGLSVKPWPFYYDQGRDLQILSGFFGNLPNEFNFDPLLKSKVVLASRYHAIQFAVQVGKPFVAVNYDEKIRNFCSDFGFADVCFEVSDPSGASKKVREIIANPQPYRERIELVRSALKQSGAELRNQINRAVG